MITHHDLNAACERAAAWKRQLAVDAGAPEGNIRERIVSMPAHRAVSVGDGWLRVGHVVDTELSAWLEVWLHPESGRIGVERDPEDEPWDCLLYTSPSPRDRTRS